MSVSRCVYVICAKVIPPALQLPSPLTQFPIILWPSTGSLFNVRRACKQSQLNCVCNSGQASCMHWLNLPRTRWPHTHTHTLTPTSPSTIYLGILFHPSTILSVSLSLARAGGADRRLQGLDIACEICPATWQRHLRMPSEYGAKDFDGISPECHRWVRHPCLLRFRPHLHFLLLHPLNPSWILTSQQVLPHFSCIRIVSELLAFARPEMATFYTLCISLRRRAL